LIAGKDDLTSNQINWKLQPTTAKTKTPYSLVAGLTTPFLATVPSMLSRSIQAKRLIRIDFIFGPVMETVLSEGYSQVDTVDKVAQGLKVMPRNITDVNGQSIQVTLNCLSSEQRYAVRDALDSDYDTSIFLQKKLIEKKPYVVERVFKAFNIDTKDSAAFQHAQGFTRSLMSDDAPGMKLACQDHFDYLQDQDPVDEAWLLSCSQHVSTNFWETFLPMVTDRDVARKILNQQKWLYGFGDARLKDVVWAALKRIWSANFKQPHMACRYEVDHFTKNCYYMHPGLCGALKNNNQMTENQHLHEIKNLVRAVLRELGRKPKLPQPAAFCIEEVFVKKLREHSQTLERKLRSGTGFSFKKVYTAQDDRDATKFANEPFLVRMAPGFWVWRTFSDGVLVQCTVAEAKQAIALVNQILDGTIDHLTDEETYLVCTFHYTTVDDCIFCVEFFNKAGCPHVLGVRKLENASLDDLVFAFPRGQRDSLITRTQATRQAQSRKKKDPYVNSRYTCTDVVRLSFAVL
jgi:hypothetical protein